MLEHGELCVVLRTNHEWVEACVRDSAAVLAAYVEEDRALAIPVLVAFPVALLVGAQVQIVEVVDEVVKLFFLKLVKIDVR